MDSLFMIQRYWGSDEENNEEERHTANFHSADDDPNFSNKKRKLDPFVIDIDSEKNCNLPNKKQKLGFSIPEISIKDNSDDDCSSSNKGETDSSLSHNDIEIVSDIIPSSSQESIEDKTRYFTANKISSETLKVTKRKNVAKVSESSEKSTPSKYEVLNVVERSFDLTENSNDNNRSKIGKKQKLDTKLPENNKFTKHDVSNMMADSTIEPKRKRRKSSLDGMFDANEVQSKKVKQKIKDVKLKESSKKDTSQEYVIDNSQGTENINQNFLKIGKTYQENNERIKPTLPHWMSSPTYVSVNLQEKETPISELYYLDSNTKKNLKNININFLFPVQLAVIPWLMQSKEQSLLIRPSDICVSAPTGSGKTLAFVLPIVQSLKDRVVCAIRALIVLPVRELAIQVYKVFETFIQGTDLKVALLTGSKSFVAEQNALVKSSGQSVQSLVDIVVTTPGRIHDHLYRTKGFCLKRLRYLVIDEADRMMDEIQQGWLKQVEDAVFHDCIFSDCICSSFKRMFYEPTSAYNFGFISQPLQKLLYSATLTHDPEQLHSLSLYKPKLFTASSACLETEYKGSCTIPSELKMLQVICEENIKPMVICHLVKQHNFKRVLCFTETVERAHRLHLVLEEMGLVQVREISSFNRAVQRKIVLEQFSSGKVDILVCSDLVARGIDIEDIDCVISYDVPQYVKTYVHRIGRTARAGKTGTAITLLSEGEIPSFKKLLTPAGIQLPEKVYINSEDLKPLVDSYQTALSVADTKLKKEKYQLPERSRTKRKRQ